MSEKYSASLRRLVPIVVLAAACSSLANGQDGQHTIKLLSSSPSTGRTGMNVAPPDAVGRVERPLPFFARIYDGSTDKESIPMRDALWHIFALVDLLEKNEIGSGRQLLMDAIGLRDVAASALTQYISEAIAANQQLVATLYGKMCANRQSIDTASALAREVSNIDEKTRQDMETHVYNIAVVLDGQDEQLVHRWVNDDVRPNMTRVTFDRLAQYSASTIGPAADLRRLCD